MQQPTAGSSGSPLRAHPLLAPPDGPLPEPEIHARLVEAAGVFTAGELEPLRAAARLGRREFAAALAGATRANPRLGAVTPVVLYRTLGETLPNGAAAAAALWPVAHRCATLNPDSVRRAGFGEGSKAADRARARPRRRLLTRLGRRRRARIAPGSAPVEQSGA